MAYRFPILLMRDAAGFFTAALVEDPGDVAALAETAAEARAQVKEHLERLYKAEPWRPGPDFEDARLVTLKVEVRPEYRQGDRVHPVIETIALACPVVTGTSESGLRVAAMPTLGIRFSYYAEEDLRPLVTQYVQSRLKGHTPAEVAALLPPAHVELDDVVIHAPRERKERSAMAALPELSGVADPLGSRELRNRFGRAWQREELVGRVVDALRKEAAPILLLGEAGVGKTTVLADAVRRIERDVTTATAVGPRASSDLDDVAGAGRRVHRFWLTSGPRVIAGMQYLGMWQERVELVIAELASIAGVLCVENVLDLVRTGGTGPGDSIGAFLVPYLQRGELRLIGEATPSELDALRRLAPALADLFQVIAVPPMGRAEAIECLAQVAAVRRQGQKVEVERGVVEAVYRLFGRFMPYQHFPGPAVGFLADLFEEASEREAGERRIRPDDVLDLFVRRTGLPELFLRDDIPLGVEEVVKSLRRDVVGQERACRAAATVVTTFKAGLNDPGRPLGVLLFAGPTGVGKTQLAQSLARFLFGAGEMEHASSGARLVRLDMSEYSGPDAAGRFLGSAASGPAEWIQGVRRQPFTVVLLDEVEKASPEVFDMLLGVFDEGRLTDPWGRLTHFTSAVIVMTTNLGAGLGEPFGLSRTAAVDRAYEGEAMGFFRPEFFNRIDAVVVFDPLAAEDMRAIASKELGELAMREGLAKVGVKLEWSGRLLDRIAAEGFDARYGARPLQRAIEMRVVTPLARYLVERPTVSGARLRLDVDEAGEVTIAPA